MKKSILATILLGSVVLMNGMTVSAEETDTKITEGDVSFTAPDTGALSIVEAASLNFDNHAISADDEEYASISDTKATVQDIRGTEAGWSLQVSQEGQFKNGTTELTNAQISFDTLELSEESTATANVFSDLILTPSGDSIVVMNANEGQGNGLAIENFGIGKSSLSVPGKTVKKQGKYTTTLNWILADTVSND